MASQAIVVSQLARPGIAIVLPNAISDKGAAAFPSSAP